MSLLPFPYELVRALLGLPLHAKPADMQKELAWLCHEHFGQVSIEEPNAPVGAGRGYFGAEPPGSEPEVSLLESGARPHFHLLQSRSDLAPMHLEVRPLSEDGWEMHWRKELAQVSSPQDLHFVCDWLASAVCKSLIAPFNAHVNQAVGAWDAAGRPGAKVALIRVTDSAYPFLLWDVWASRNGEGWRVRLEMHRH